MHMKLEPIVESAEELPQVAGIRFEGMSVPPLYHPTLSAGALAYWCGTSNPAIGAEER
jgi:hypothetical protein